MNGRVLIVDDDSAMCETLESILRRRGLTTASCTSTREASELLAVEDFDVIVTDWNLGGASGLELCEHVAANRPDLPVIVVTAFGSLDAAIAAIRAGAYDFVTKPFEVAEIALTVERALSHRQLREEVRRLRTATPLPFTEMIGTSAPMQRVYELIARVAETEATVLVTGESGTGKELVARAIHARSPRAGGPFVVVNCAAMPEPLLESELFGHTKGAFTDAQQARQGLFLTACGGTLFLDEIGEMPLGTQAKLLRVLQERTVRPVGADTEVPFDARIVVATNRDLESEVDERRFREDLYYRVNVVRICVPTLRARSCDVLVLAQHFVQRFSLLHGADVTGLSSAAAERLVAYPWPGNVRELQNCIERAVALARQRTLGVDDLPDAVRDHRARRPVVESDDPADLMSMDEVERRYILRVLETVGGNKTLAAQVLGFDRRTLYRKLERYEKGDAGGAKGDGGAARENVGT
jgi:two-component system response regulator HydG